MTINPETFERKLRERAEARRTALGLSEDIVANTLVEIADILRASRPANEMEKSGGAA